MLIFLDVSWQICGLSCEFSKFTSKLLVILDAVLSFDASLLLFLGGPTELPFVATTPSLSSPFFMSEVEFLV